MKTIEIGSKKRESNIELLRILCMILIVAHHGMAHGGAAYMEMCSNKLFALVMIPGGKICFNAFIAISTYFLVDSRFKTERVAKIWFEVFLYSVVFFFVSKHFGVQTSRRDLLSVFFPIAGNSHGFAASYLAFYLLTPFLNIIAKKVNRRQLKVLVVLLFYFEIATQILGDVFNYTQPIASELWLFVFWYFFQMYLKRYPLKIQKNWPVLLGLFAPCWFLVFGVMYIFFGLGKTDAIGSLLWNLVNDESSIINIIGGAALFYLFKNIRVPYSKIINSVATGTFGVLLIHDHNFLRNPLWHQIVRMPENYYRDDFVLWTVKYTVVIFFVCCVIDWIRRLCIEKPIFGLKIVNQLCVFFDNKINSPETCGGSALEERKQ